MDSRRPGTGVIVGGSSSSRAGGGSGGSGGSSSSDMRNRGGHHSNRLIRLSGSGSGSINGARAPGAEETQPLI